MFDVDLHVCIVCTVSVVFQHQQLHRLPSQLVNTAVVAVPAVPGQMGDVLGWVLTHLCPRLAAWFPSNCLFVIQSTLRPSSSLWGSWLGSSSSLSSYAAATAAAVAWRSGRGKRPENVQIYLYIYTKNVCFIVCVYIITSMFFCRLHRTPLIDGMKGIYISI